MDIEQALGQLLIIGFKGADLRPDSPIAEDIRQRNLGGVILFDRFLCEQLPENNIVSPSQVRKLTTELQAMADIPLLVAVDQEGGKVSRFKAARGFAETLPATILGEEKTTQTTAAAAEQTAGLLASLGINFNLAPVVDLNSCPDNPIISRYQRSFSADPHETARHAAAWISAHRSHGLLSCLKHFPGHGSAREDSHLGFVDISDSWYEEELIPYRELIRQDLVDCIMTGHLYNRFLDPDFPATLSAETVSGLLREQLGYDGPVISDDMQMRAITSHFGFEEGVCRALNGGVDLLIFGNNLAYDPDMAKKALDVMREGLRNGALRESRVHEALQHVARLKQALPAVH